MWKKLGKEGLAVQAPWPVAEEEDKILTRQAQFLRATLKKTRSQVGKAKKAFAKASVVVADSYPQWKVDTLTWMQDQYDESITGSFPATFMKDLKAWAGANVSDKKQMKFTMQFAAFMKNEVAEVGKVALDVQLPFDQASILNESLQYLKSQLNLENLDVVKVDAAEGIPDRVAEQVTPGSPTMWLQ